MLLQGGLCSVYDTAAKLKGGMTVQLGEAPGTVADVSKGTGVRRGFACDGAAYYAKWLSLERVWADCGVSRDGSNARNVLKAARSYGLTAKGYRYKPELLKEDGKFLASSTGISITLWYCAAFWTGCAGVGGDVVFLYHHACHNPDEHEAYQKEHDAFLKAERYAIL